ncbi:hypothetical protein PM082_012515 [Marasmius tenuissimus]|nr:hypothetical protein PM082_012515 [Marasmius tenuissimus]
MATFFNQILHQEYANKYCINTNSGLYWVGNQGHVVRSGFWAGLTVSVEMLLTRVPGNTAMETQVYLDEILDF